ncbi:MAG: Ldh family oxidoreductase [Candidatus Limnocylindrales bacterium]
MTGRPVASSGLASQGVQMHGYAGMESERRVDPSALHRFVEELFSKAGVSADDATLMADIVLHTDARGVYSHGTAAVAGYIDKLLDGQINPSAKPRVVGDRGGSLVVDGDGGLGHIACVYGMRQAILRARQTGVALAAVGHSNHCGAMSYYPTLAMAEGMIGIAGTNALPCMAPWHGRDRIVPISPIGIGIPSRAEIPILLDISFGEVARGKIVVHYQKGLPLPEGWAFDSEGRPTTDAAAAVKGLNQPAGGPKGVGLGLVVGMLSALLSGADYAGELGSLDTGPNPGRDGQIMMAIDISAYQEPTTVTGRVDKIVREFRNSRPIEGVDRVYLPGELEIETEQRFRREGIPVSDVTISALNRVARRLNVDAEWLH